jgi:hypothetical protein
VGRGSAGCCASSFPAWRSIKPGNGASIEPRIGSGNGGGIAQGAEESPVPREVAFSADARTRFWQFTADIEEQMMPGGDYSSIPHIAELLPEHAARSAAVLAAYRDLNFAELGWEDYQRGVQIACFYASEATRQAIESERRNSTHRRLTR